MTDSSIAMVVAADGGSMTLSTTPSRTLTHQEFQADLGAVRLPDHPQALVQILTKMNPGNPSLTHSADSPYSRAVKRPRSVLLA